MQKKKTKHSMSRLFSLCLSVIMAMALFVVPVMADETQPAQACKVTVTNGAASANVENEAYNTLHVFDENDPEMTDFTGEKEFSVGDQITYYMAAYASPVKLTVVHNGTTIEESVVEWGEISDMKTVTLEGDLQITTEAVTQETNWTVTIDQTDIPGDPSISVDDTVITNGAQITGGVHSFLVQGDFVTDELMSAYASLYVNGKQVGEAVEIGYDDALFENVDVTGNVTIRIAAQAEEAETYSVSINKEADVPGELLIYADNTELTSGSEIAKGTHTFSIYGDETEGQNDALVSVSVDGTAVGEEQNIDGYNGIEFKDVEVNGNVEITVRMPKQFTVSVKNNVTEDVTFDVMSVEMTDDGPVPLTLSDGDKVSEGQYVALRVLNPTDKKLRLTQLDATGKVVQSSDVLPKEGDEDGAGGLRFEEGLTEDSTFVLDYAPITYTVTVQNDAAKANTDSNVNGLHVYDSSSSDMTDLEGVNELEAGTPITIYPYPTASAIRLQVIHNGETIYDKNIHQMTAWVDDDKIEFIDLTLEGDLTVIATAIDAYPVKITDNVKDEKVVFTVGTVDFSGDVPKNVELKDGDALLAGEMAAARAINDGDKILRLNVIRNSDNSIVQKVFIAPGEANGVYIDAAEDSYSFVLDAVTLKISSVSLKKTSKVYTGKKITFDKEITVKAKINGEAVTLKKGTDYTISYKNNVNAGKKASVTITGKGNYKGSITKTFTITKAKQPMTVAKANKVVKYKTVKKKNVAVAKALTVTKAQGKVTYARVSKGSSKYLSVNSKGKIIVKKGTPKGTYQIKVKVTAKGNANYNKGSKTVTVKVVVK